MLRQTILVAALAALFSMPSAAGAAEAVAREETDVYDQPNANGNVIATLREGTIVDLGECGGSYCVINKGPGRGGFVRAAALDLNPRQGGAARTKPAGFPREVQVLADADVYDQPGGGGNVIAVVRQGKTLLTRKCRTDNWCPIAGGWVWGDFLAR